MILVWFEGHSCVDAEFLNKIRFRRGSGVEGELRDEESQVQTRFRIRRGSGLEEIQDQKRFRTRRDSGSEEIQYQKRFSIRKELWFKKSQVQ